LNLVVTTNKAAVNLWLSLGFEIIGTLPGVFHHATLGYVDAHVMFLGRRRMITLPVFCA
jgi:hypothetical protein